MVEDGKLLDYGRTIRTQAAFEQSLHENKNRFITLANETTKLLADIMTQFQTLKSSLAKFSVANSLIKDINERLNTLIYRGFIRNTPYMQLTSLPRYLKAAQYRLEKYDNNVTKCQEIARYCVRYWQDVEKRAKKTTVIPEYEVFRWALEEFRVSLFAQQFKTAYPISAKRMDKLWDERS